MKSFLLNKYLTAGTSPVTGDKFDIWPIVLLVAAVLIIGIVMVLTKRKK